MEALLIIPISERASFNSFINTRFGYAPTEQAFGGLLYADLAADASHAMTQLHNLTGADVAALDAFSEPMSGCHLYYHARGERAEIDKRLTSLGLLARHAAQSPP